jgi:hypothetical protein
MQLEQVVPWGRNANEYRRMFELSPADLSGRILGCGDGPASFNAELTATGHQIISTDPIYGFSGAEIRSRVNATYATIIDQVKQQPDYYRWHEFATPDALGAVRLAAMETFLADYDTGKAEGRYIEGALPLLPFADSSFDLALCSHLLFLYSEQLDATFHIAALQELLRVAKEVRVFPLLTLACEPSPHLTSVLAWCDAHGHHADLCQVPYEFQVGGDTMLQVQRA